MSTEHPKRESMSLEEATISNMREIERNRGSVRTERVVYEIGSLRHHR